VKHTLEGDSGDLPYAEGEGRKILSGFDAEFGYNGSEVPRRLYPGIAVPVGGKSVGLSPQEMRL
jgi:hypothetical protein